MRSLLHLVDCAFNLPVPLFVDDIHELLFVLSQTGFIKDLFESIHDVFAFFGLDKLRPPVKFIEAFDIVYGYGFDIGNGYVGPLRFFQDTTAGVFPQCYCLGVFRLWHELAAIPMS